MKTTSVIALSCYSLSVFLTSFMKNLAGYCVFYGFFSGFFFGLAYLICFRNTFSYFPHRKGMCAGICSLGFGIGSFIFNELFLKFVNPDNVQADQNHIFPKDVANRLPKTFMVMSAIYFGLGCLTNSLLFPLKNKEDALLESQLSEEDSEKSSFVSRGEERIAETPASAK